MESSTSSLASVRARLLVFFPLMMIVSEMTSVIVRMWLSTQQKATLRITYNDKSKFLVCHCLAMVGFLLRNVCLVSEIRHYRHEME